MNRFLAFGSFLCVALVVAAAPWLFGAWEAWWFWPLAALLCFSGVLAGLASLVPPRTPSPSASVDDTPPPSLAPSWGPLLGSALPFVVYAVIRAFQAEVVIDAERSVMLLLTPCFLAITVVLMKEPYRRRLYGILVFNLLAVGLYGIVNHLVTKSHWVMWLKGYPQYIVENRATGPYFCPDHFAGAMELALALSLGLLVARHRHRPTRRVAGALGAVALIAIVMSKSRGGGLTILVMSAMLLVIGFAQWPPAIRWWWRLSMAAGLALAMILFFSLDTSYMRRFDEHFGWSRSKDQPLRERVEGVKATLLTSSRGRMFAGAFRAWRSEPLWGIGPGMHQNLWPHFAASEDGDREQGIWPSMPNYDFHSYEVHNDWLQLLEEYGVVGLLLFLIPCGVLTRVLWRGIRMESAAWQQQEWRKTGTRRFAAVLSAVLALVAMAFHSLGDFNLQIPANTWMLAAIIALPLPDILAHRDAESGTTHT